MSEPGIEQRICGLGSLFANFPNANPIIDSTSRQSFAFWAKRDGINLLERLAESVATLAAGNVPEFDRAIGAGAGQNFSVGPE